MINLKISAHDGKEGAYSYHKTLLVNALPEASVKFIVIEASVGKSFTHDFA